MPSSIQAASSGPIGQRGPPPARDRDAGSPTSRGRRPPGPTSSTSAAGLSGGSGPSSGCSARHVAPGPGPGRARGRPRRASRRASRPPTTRPDRTAGPGVGSPRARRRQSATSPSAAPVSRTFGGSRPTRRMRDAARPSRAWSWTMRTRPVAASGRRAGVERAGGAGDGDAQGVDLARARAIPAARRPGAPRAVGSRTGGRRRTSRRVIRKPSSSPRPPSMRSITRSRGRSARDEGWKTRGGSGRMGPPGRTSGCPAIGPVGGGIASLRGSCTAVPVTGSSRVPVRARLARNRGLHHPRQARCRTVPDAHRHHDRIRRRRQPARGRRAQGPARARAGRLHGAEPRGARRPPRRSRCSTRSGWRSSSPVSASSTCCPATTSGSPASSRSGSRTRRPTAPRWPRCSTSSGSRPTCRSTRSLPIHNQLAKLLGRLSQRAHEVVELIWSALGRDERAPRDVGLPGDGHRGRRARRAVALRDAVQAPAHPRGRPQGLLRRLRT